MSFHVQDRVDSKALSRYIKALKNQTSYRDKLCTLLKEKEQKVSDVEVLSAEEVKERYITSCLSIMGQTPLLQLLSEASSEKKRDLMAYLESLDACFAPAGGLIAYQESVAQLLKKQDTQLKQQDFSLPQGHDLTDSDQARKLAFKGLVHLNEICALFPIGGAADRLNRGRANSVASANFSFLGKTLLKRLVEDISAAESLYFKLFNSQVTVPLFLMVSSKKEHVNQIRDQLEKSVYFLRPKSSIKIGSQPLVPLFNERGIWHIDSEGHLLAKPGGHGMLWKVAMGAGWMDEALTQKRKMVVRQINNPIAGTDNVLMAFQGLGFALDATFGALGCEKQEGMKEGTWAIKKREGKGSFLTNVEYCESASVELTKKQISQRMLANTNILFADIEKVMEAVKKDPFPGKLLNFRTDVAPGGKLYKLARLETMMQNISEHFQVGGEEKCSSFVAFSKRDKTMSCIKKMGQKGASLMETPGQCLLDFTIAAASLLTSYCNSFVPKLEPDKPSFVFSYHRALGPFYEIIGQKVQRVHLERSAFVQLEIAELFMRDCMIDGALYIKADQVMGHIEKGATVYSDQVGSCVLERVRVSNKGADLSGAVWEEGFTPSQALKIQLQGRSRFVARDVTFTGEHTICVPDGVFMEAIANTDGEIIFHCSKLEEAGPLYEYSSSEKGAITLKQVF